MQVPAVVEKRLLVLAECLEVLGVKASPERILEALAMRLPLAVVLQAMRGEIPSAGQTLEQAGKHCVTAALASAGGNITKAARRLGISRRGLYDQMYRWGLKNKKEAT